MPMNSSPGLSEDEVRRFAEDGFLGPFKLYEPEEAHEILKQIRIGNLDRSRAIFDNDVNYDRHFDIPELTRHIGHAGIVKRLRGILGNDLLCWRTEFMPKFPGSVATEWHQVEFYQYATGTPQLVPTRRVDGQPIDLTVWTTFTEATVENGCMKFMPGSQRTLYFDESLIPSTGRDNAYESVKAATQFFGYNFADFKIDPDWQPDESEAVVMEMAAGECVIFTAKCMHGSLPNTSKRSTRFAITARYVPTHVRVYPDQTSFTAHGGHFDLRSYGCVLVSGTENNLGEPFPYVDALHESV